MPWQCLSHYPSTGGSHRERSQYAWEGCGERGGVKGRVRRLGDNGRRWAHIPAPCSSLGTPHTPWERKKRFFPGTNAAGDLLSLSGSHSGAGEDQWALTWRERLPAPLGGAAPRDPGRSLPGEGSCAPAQVPRGEVPREPPGEGAGLLRCHGNGPPLHHTDNFCAGKLFAGVVLRALNAT